MPRVLLIAESANPEWVSVPLEGWSHSRAIMDLTDAHLVTQIRNRDAILRAGLIEGENFTAIDSEAFARPAHRLASLIRGKSGVGWTTTTALQTLSYPYFESLVWKQFGPLIRRGEFDIVHRITPLSPTTPSPIAAKCRNAGVPFVMGPLNGGVPWPKGFDGARRREKEWLSYVRDAYKLLPGYHATRQNASAIIIESRDTWRQVPRSYRRKCFYVPENAIDSARFQKRRTHRATNPLKAVFVGRLVPYKGADMLLEAASGLLSSGRMTLDVVGDGPQMSQLRRTANERGFAKNVKFSGWVRHKEVQDRLVQADVFTFPSIREFGGAVALEAMAVGVVPVVPNYGGLGELVSKKSGFLIEMGSRQEIIGRLREVLHHVVDQPDLVDQKSDAAWRRAHEQFTWHAKAKQTLEVYDWVLGRRDQRPAMPALTPDLN